MPGGLIMARWWLALLLAGSLASAETFVLCAGVEKYDDERISALKYGVAKINIGNALSVAWCTGSRDALDGGCDHYGVLKTAMDKVRAVAQHRLQLFGAAGRAA